jgi:hypothetical protein
MWQVFKIMGHPSITCISAIISNSFVHNYNQAPPTSHDVLESQYGTAQIKTSEFLWESNKKVVVFIATKFCKKAAALVNGVV